MLTAPPSAVNEGRDRLLVKISAFKSINIIAAFVGIETFCQQNLTENELRRRAKIVR